MSHYQLPVAVTSTDPCLGRYSLLSQQEPGEGKLCSDRWPNSESLLLLRDPDLQLLLPQPAHPLKILLQKEKAAGVILCVAEAVPIYPEIPPTFFSLGLQYSECLHHPVKHLREHAP